jgi:hypothetical protein
MSATDCVQRVVAADHGATTCENPDCFHVLPIDDMGRGGTWSGACGDDCDRWDWRCDWCGGEGGECFCPGPDDEYERAYARASIEDQERM